MQTPSLLLKKSGMLLKRYLSVPGIGTNPWRWDDRLGCWLNALHLTKRVTNYGDPFVSMNCLIIKIMNDYLPRIFQLQSKQRRQSIQPRAPITPLASVPPLSRSCPLKSIIIGSIKWWIARRCTTIRRNRVHRSCTDHSNIFISFGAKGD